MNREPLRGCLYWVALPAEPGAKERPALVISVNSRNRLAGDVMVVPASTTLTAAPTHVRLRRGTGGLPQDSVLKCEQLTTIPKRFLGESALGGPISAELLVDVTKGVLRAMGLPAD